MDAIFIRHNLTATFKVLNELWRKRLIAVHFEDKYSASPEDYKNAGKVALTRLRNCCRRGAVAGAYYRQIKPASILVGSIKPGSRIEAKKIGKHIYKVVRLENAREIKSPLLLAIQPRQATITGWPSAKRYLEAIFKRKQIPLEVNSLNPNQLEVICYEYLRKKKILKLLLMPIGRTLRDVDIWGIDDKGQTVLAQVTFANNYKDIKAKVARLKCQQAKNDRLFFFGPAAQKIDEKDMEYISIEEVFDDFKSNSGPAYLLMLKQMLAYEIV